MVNKGAQVKPSVSLNNFSGAVVDDGFTQIDENPKELAIVNVERDYCRRLPNRYRALLGSSHSASERYLTIYLNPF